MFLATPAKFHYVFNLRDLSRIYEGCCLATIDCFDTGAKIARLWRNECTRVFCDRTATAEDFTLVNEKISSIIQAKWAGDSDTILAEPMIFGDYEQCVDRLISDSEDPRLYKDLGRFDQSRKIFTEVMDNYNLDRNPMTLVLFEYALEHLVRVHRIIRMSRGCGLLIGVGGSGKQSMTKLAAFCAGQEVFGITLTRGYGEMQFREDMKELYRMLLTKEVVFLFTDAHVANEGFLESINNMITTGIIPALFEPDERDSLINNIRKDVKQAGIVDTADNCWNYYVNRCRANLHVVLAMSPSMKLRVRCRNFPGLISGCVIDWYFTWPEDALTKVAEFFLSEVSLPTEQRPGIVGHLVFAHREVMKLASRFADELRRKYYVTPKNYLDFISNYKLLLMTNDKKIDESVKRLEGGLTKLIEAASAVDRMTVDLKEQKVVVDAKTADVEALIAVIQDKTIIANQQQEEAQVKQKEAEEQAKVIEVEKEKADKALNEALPAVEAAAAALDNLDQRELQELASFASPDARVVKVTTCCIILNVTGDKTLTDDWAGGKRLLKTSGILNLLKKYKRDEIKDKQIERVKKFFKDKEFTPEGMMKTSKAAGGLLGWVNAIVNYHEIAKNVTPLREKVKQMQKEQAATEKELNALNHKLSELAAELKDLDADYGTQSAALNELQVKANLMEKRLAAASKLIVGLSGERTRWTESVGDLQEQKTRLVGDCLLASSFLSYAGAFSNTFRAEMMSVKFDPDIRGREIPLTMQYNVRHFLTTNAVEQDWIAKGLPADEHSIQNGILR